MLSSPSDAELQIPQAWVKDASASISSAFGSMAPVKVFVVAESLNIAQEYIRKWPSTTYLFSIDQLRGVARNRILVVLHGDYFKARDFPQIKALAISLGAQFAVSIPPDEV